MHQVFCNSIPYAESVRDAAVINKIIRGNRPRHVPEAAEKGFTLAVWHLMQMCWHPDWRIRPAMGAVKIMLHHALNGLIPLTRFRSLRAGPSSQRGENEIFLDVLYGCDSFGPGQALPPLIFSQYGVIKSQSFNGVSSPQTHQPGREDAPIPTLFALKLSATRRIRSS